MEVTPDVTVPKELVHLLGPTSTRTPVKSPRLSDWLLDDLMTCPCLATTKTKAASMATPGKQLLIKTCQTSWILNPNPIVKFVVQISNSYSRSTKSRLSERRRPNLMRSAPQWMTQPIMTIWTVPDQSPRTIRVSRILSSLLQTILWGKLSNLLYNL